MQKEYILASRQAETKLQSRLLGAGALVLMVVMVLGAISFWQWDVARSNAQEARANAQEAQANAREARANAEEARMQASIALSRQLVAQSTELRGSQPDASLLLNLEAMRRAPAAAKEEARSALMDNLARPYHVATQLTGHTGQVTAVAFNPDGKLLTSAGEDKTVRLWEVAGESLVANACTTANRNLSQVEWSKFVGAEFNHVRSCSTLPAG